MGDKFKKAIETKQALFQEQNDTILKLYNETKDHIIVAKQLGLHPSNVSRTLKRVGVQDLPKRGERLTLVKSCPFIGGEESNYWIGILATDGSLDFNRKRIALGMIDKEHIEKFVKFTKSNISINVYTSLKFPDSILYRTQFTDKATFDYLESVGFCKNKTFDIELKIQFTPDILRGIFEGDGCICYINNKKGARISICSASINFARQIKHYLRSQKIECKTSIRVRKTPLYMINVHKKESVLRYINLMYSNATIFLDRKRVQCLDIAKALSETPSNSVNQH